MRTPVATATGTAMGESVALQTTAPMAAETRVWPTGPSYLPPIGKDQLSHYGDVVEDVVRTLVVVPPLPASAQPGRAHCNALGAEDIGLGVVPYEQRVGGHSAYLGDGVLEDAWVWLRNT